MKPHNKSKSAKRARPKPNRAARHAKSGGKRPRESRGQMPEMSVLTITALTEEGELLAEPVKWDSRKKPPHIVVTESGRGKAAAVGDRVLAKLRPVRPQFYAGAIIRILPNEDSQSVLGIFMAAADGGMIEPVSRKHKESYMVERADVNGAAHGDLVSGTALTRRSPLGMRFAKIEEKLGALNSPRAASLIASHMHALPMKFSEEALSEAEKADTPSYTSPASGGGRVGEREDLRKIPLVTIDGEDARDFDDAVFAEADGDGFHLLVAIADVAHYVKLGSALDREAFERGNSVYFPDRVIPMLPERLSNGLCSLNPNEDRYCMAVHIWIDKNGHRKRYQFVRGIMRSTARLTYEAVQAAHDKPGKKKHPQQTLIDNLYAAYAALSHERDARGVLNLNLPEYKVYFAENGEVEDIRPRQHAESNRLIEAFMIAANVAAADFLLKAKRPAVYRVHEHPADEKIKDLRDFLKISGYALPPGVLKAADFNAILKKSEDKPEMFMIHSSVLRAQMPAFYSQDNLGHFGLNLRQYTHFTSPIRRYSDLIVHRALIDELDKEKTSGDNSRLPEIALHISDTERRAMQAERDANDRYKIAFMSKKLGQVFPGVITGLNEYGLFVSLHGNGVTGFIPVRNLRDDFYAYDREHKCFKGRRTRNRYRLGDAIAVELQEANSLTGSLIFAIARPGTTSAKSGRKKY